MLFISAQSDNQSWIQMYTNACGYRNIEERKQTLTNLCFHIFSLGVKPNCRVKSFSYLFLRGADAFRRTPFNLRRPHHGQQKQELCRFLPHPFIYLENRKLSHSTMNFWGEKYKAKKRTQKCNALIFFANSEVIFIKWDHPRQRDLELSAKNTKNWDRDTAEQKTFS